MVLSESAVCEYERDGFIVLPNLLSKAEKSHLSHWTQEVQDWPETKGKWMQYFEIVKGQRQLCRTENYLDYHDGLKSLIEGKLTNAVSQCMREPSILFKEKVNYKLPGGAGFTAHQDAPAYIKFPVRHHITAMVAVDELTVENGTLELVRGEHEKGLFAHPSGVIDHKITDVYDKEESWKPVIAEAGTVILFHSYVPHRSGKNLTEKPRRVHYLTFNPIADGEYRNAYYAEKRAMFPPDIERIPGVDYSEGAKIYNLSNPMPTMLGGK